MERSDDTPKLPQKLCRWACAVGVYSVWVVAGGAESGLTIGSLRDVPAVRHWPLNWPTPPEVCATSSSSSWGLASVPPETSTAKAAISAANSSDFLIDLSYSSCAPRAGRASRPLPLSLVTVSLGPGPDVSDPCIILRDE